MLVWQQHWHLLFLSTPEREIAHCEFERFFADRFAQLHATQLTLKPLFFEVPLLEAEPLFIGRQWLLHELESVIINGSSFGMLISGSPGTGKTALILEMVEHSCFGRRRGQLPATEQEITAGEREKVDPSNLQLSVRSTNEIVCFITLFGPFVPSEKR